MFKDLFVPYQESMELKQLGFDEPCFAYYDEEAGETEPYEYANCCGNVTGDKSCYNDDFLSVTNSQLDKYGAFGAKDEEGDESYERWTAPIYDQAFKFFRDKYNLYSYVEPVLVEEAKSPIKFDYVILGLDIKEENYNNLPYHTYEQARLECLKQLIKIVKNDTTN